MKILLVSLFEKNFLLRKMINNYVYRYLSVVIFFILFPLIAQGATCGLIPASNPVFSGTALELKNKISINGNTVSKGTYMPNAAISASGNITTNVNTTLPSLNPSNFPVNNSTSNLTIKKTTTLNHSSEVFYNTIDITKKKINVNFTGGGPFHINQLNVNADNVTLNFSAGTYYINDFNILKKNITINTSSSPVIFHIKNKFKINGSGANINNTGSVANLQIYLHKGAEFESKKKNLKFAGLIYGPNVKKVEIEGKNSSIRGAIVVGGGPIQFKQKNISLTYTTAVQTAISNISTCGGIGITNPDHYELSLPSSSLTCLPTTVIITACADNSSPCTNSDSNVSGNTANLATNGGALAQTTVTFNATGIATTTLTYPAAINLTVTTITLSGEQTAATNARQCCPNGSSCLVANSCSTTFNSAGFIFSSVADAPSTIISTQTAGTTSANYYLRAVKTNTTTKACETALTGTTAVNMAYECNNPTTCSSSNLLSINGGTATTIVRNNNGSVVNYTPVNMNFDANGNAPFNFIYNDVGLLTLYANKTVNSAILNGISNAFVSKPSAFLLSNIKQTASPFTANPIAANSTGAVFVKAGEDFTATITATTSTGSATPNFGNESIAEGVKLSPTLILPAAGNTGTISNNIISGVSFSNGVATVTNLSWDEVGIITLTPSIADTNYLGVGDISATTTANIGRFIPDHFAVSGSLNNRKDLSCAPASTFTYMDEPFELALTLTAQNLANSTTLNYTTANGFAKLDSTTARWLTLGSNNSLGVGVINSTTTPLTSRLVLDTSIAMPSGIWIAGIGNLNANFYLSRPITNSSDGTWGAYENLNFGIAPQDTDAVTILNSALNLDADNNVTNERVFIATGKSRFGRVEFQNAYGSELLDLPASLTTQYWNGSNWILNSNDLCSSGISLSTTDPIATDGLIPAELCAWDSGSPGNSSIGCSMAGTSNNQFNEPPLATNAGNFNLNFKATGNGNNGALDVTASVSNYLKFNWQSTGNINPTARITFGVYKGNSKQIYFRELY